MTTQAVDLLRIVQINTDRTMGLFSVPGVVFKLDVINALPDRLAVQLYIGRCASAENLEFCVHVIPPFLSHFCSSLGDY